MQVYLYEPSDEQLLNFYQRQYPTSTFLWFAGNNLNCPYAQQMSLTWKPEFERNIRDVRRMLELGPASVVFCGGEPTLQPQALRYLTRFSKAGNREVVLETNGTKPQIIRAMLKEWLIDKVVLLMPAPFEEDDFERVTHSKTFFVSSSEIIVPMRETLELLRNADCKLAVRTTVVPGLMYKKEHLAAIAQELVGLKTAVWQLQPLYPQGGMVNKRLLSLHPPSEDFLIFLKNHCLEHYPQLKIEILA
ncbi:radical SAM protein [Candidatus Woesearchaeota archaeon]|nr:radical SAM protein [Candidatus Woesearchaeota archaeon]